MKGMVKGEIQIIPQCIFGKFSFPTYGLAMIQNDTEIDNYSLVYFLVLSYSVNSQIHFYFFFFMYTSEIILLLFYYFSDHLNIGVQM